MAGVSRVASVSIWIMDSPSGETTWAYTRHLPGWISLGGTQWTADGKLAAAAEGVKGGALGFDAIAGVGVVEEGDGLADIGVVGRVDGVVGVAGF